MRSVQGVNPQTIFFFVGGHQAQASGVGCAGFVLPPAAPYLGWGGTGEGKSPFPSFSVVLAASCQTIDRAPPPQGPILGSHVSFPHCCLWLHHPSLLPGPGAAQCESLAVWDRSGDFLDDSSIFQGLSSPRTVRDGELGEVSSGSFFFFFFFFYNRGLQQLSCPLPLCQAF